mmetsp:Transcript_81136/g.224555  ORF Transcript_81136/g.224555 Transcript_81136/m.224555 type:complete len:107 (+) Transcript_81136:867-1187(+)
MVHFHEATPTCLCFGQAVEPHARAQLSETPIVRLEGGYHVTGSGQEQCTSPNVCPRIQHTQPATNGMSKIDEHVAVGPPSCFTDLLIDETELIAGAEHKPPSQHEA